MNNRIPWLNNEDQRKRVPLTPILIERSGLLRIYNDLQRRTLITGNDRNIP